MSHWVQARIKAVFFDAVGTLLFPSPPALLVYSATAVRANLNIPYEIIRERFLAAYRAEEAIDRGAGWVTSEDREATRWRRIVYDTLAGVSDRKACFLELFDHFSKPSAWVVNPDTGQVFTALQQQGIKLGLASNYDSRLLSVIAGHEVLAPLRDRVVISSVIGFRKPAREFFAEVVHSAGCEPCEILYVGDDRENDYEGARAAGLDAVLLDTTSSAVPRLDWLTSASSAGLP